MNKTFALALLSTLAIPFSCLAMTLGKPEIIVSVGFNMNRGGGYWIEVAVENNGTKHIRSGIDDLFKDVLRYSVKEEVQSR